MKSVAVFLDRDGVINFDSAGFIKSWEEFRFMPSSLQALNALARTSFQIIVATNQSGVGRGLFTEAALQEIHARMIERVRESGGRIDAIYYCPHAPGAGCACRKPAPGMFFEAARDFDLDLASSWAIGDSIRDIEAANRAGIKAILLDRSLPDPAAPGPHFQFLRAVDLLSAVTIVLPAENY